MDIPSYLLGKKAGGGGSSSEHIQYDVMPTADATTVGKIVQYTGATDSTYTNGYFYIGTTDGEATPTYSWENIEVQANGGGGTPTYVISNESSTTDWQPVVDYYVANNCLPNIFLPGRGVLYSFVLSGREYYFEFRYTARNSFNWSTYSEPRYGVKLTVSNNIVTRVDTWNDPQAVDLRSYNDRWGVGFGNVLTTGNTASFTPTGDYNPATKKYVDDSIASAITTTLGGSY